MRTAVVYVNDGKGQVKALARGLAEGIGSQDRGSVDLLSLEEAESRRLSGYGYIAVGVPVTSWTGKKLPENFKENLSRCGLLNGKKCFAFVPKQLMGSQKTLNHLMAALEGEGVLLRYSEIFQDENHATEVGRGLKID